jgi:ABC-type multidrug transport system fused ATPase/permease subunit
VGALWRLRGYLRPFRRQMIIMLAAALGAVAAEIAIPLLTKSVIDGAIAHGARRLSLRLQVTQFSTRQPPRIPAGHRPSVAVTVTQVVTVRLGLAVALAGLASVVAALGTSGAGDGAR